MPSKRDGVWTKDGLSADFVFVKDRFNDENVCLVNTIDGLHWVFREDLRLDAKLEEKHAKK